METGNDEVGHGLGQLFAVFKMVQVRDLETGLYYTGNNMQVGPARSARVGMRRGRDYIEYVAPLAAAVARSAYDQFMGSSGIGVSRPNKRVRAEKPKSTQSAPKKTMYKKNSRPRKYTAPKRAVASRKRTYRARTYRTNRRPVGLYKARRGIAAKYSQASKHGVERIVDKGGVMADPRALYIGHSTTCIPEQLRSVAYAVVRKLTNRAGIGFKVWNQANERWAAANSEGTVAMRLAIVFTFYSQLNETQTSVFSNFIPLDASPNDAAEALYERLRIDVAEPGREVQEFFLVKQRGASSVFVANDVVERYATLQANSMLINFQVRSELTIQNQTAAARAGVNPEDSNIDEVANNPLKGMYYTTKGNVFRDASDVRNSYTIPTGTDSINVDQRGLTADNEDGLIRRDAGGSTWAAYPPNPKLIGAKTGNKMLVLPGQMKKSVLFQMYKCKFNTLMNMFQRQTAFRGSANEFIPVEWGKSALFGLRLAMNTATNERNPTVGYELKWQHKVHITTMKAEPIAPFVVTRAAT